MKLTLRDKIETVMALAILIGGLLFIHGYLSERERTAQQRGYDAAVKVVEQQQDAKIASAQADMRAAIDKLEQEKQHKPSPVEIIREVPKYVPTGPLTTSPASLPDAPSAILNTDQLQSLRTFGIMCQECAVKNAGLNTELDATKAKLDAETKRREAAEDALHGGTWKTRLVHEVKCLGITMGTAGAGAYFKGWQGASIGSGVGDAICHLF